MYGLSFFELSAVLALYCVAWMILYIIALDIENEVRPERTNSSLYKIVLGFGAPPYIVGFIVYVLVSKVWSEWCNEATRDDYF